jgi:ParB-like chromosome segregation protein Spo0J
MFFGNPTASRYRYGLRRETHVSDHVNVAVHSLANLFPPMDELSLAALVADIRAHGLREPITLYQGEIIDGVHRYRACLQAGVEPRFEAYEGSEPLSFVISKNLQRRHLDAGQRAMIAAKLATMRQGARTDLAPIGAMSDADAARALNVGERSVERAKVVRRDAVPELVAKVERGEVSIAAASAVARKSAPEQREILAGGGRAVRAASSALRKPSMSSSPSDRSPGPNWRGWGRAGRIGAALLEFSHQLEGGAAAFVITVVRHVREMGATDRQLMLRAIDFIANVDALLKGIKLYPAETALHDGRECSPGKAEEPQKLDIQSRGL